MSASPLKRKLAAILAADAVGYSRHMGADEEGTMKLLSAHRAVIDGIIEFHEGRIINTAGDSVLAEFASPVQAVRCAVEIQDALRTRNDALPEGKRLEFRIGVNLGDVMVKGDDLLGDGVNVAARLESVADPGGICVSSSVYDQIAGKLDLGFVDVGQKSLKNIDRPVRVYRVDRNGRRRSPVARRESHVAGAKWFAGLALIVALGAGAWYFVLLPQSREAERVEAAAKAKAAADERARAEQVARAQAEAETMKAAEAAKAAQAAKAAAEERIRIEQLAKARAEAKNAKRRAEKEAEAAAEARRALEAQRAADAKAGVQAEIARLRAEAEKAKRDAAAELAAAAEMRRAAEETAKAGARASAPAPADSLRKLEGNWSAEISCPPLDGTPARDLTMPLSVANEAVVIEHGEAGAPGSVSLRGSVNGDGILSLHGSGVSGRRGGSRPYRAGFRATPVGDGYQGSGRLGRRKCSLSVSRVP